MKLKKTLRRLRGNEGSETIEIIWSVLIIAGVLLCILMIMTYIIAVVNVNFAVQRVVRQAEVSGVVNESSLEAAFFSIPGMSSEALGDTNLDLKVSNVRYHSGNNVQLGDTFTVTVSGNYVIQLIEPGSYDGYVARLPIRVKVTGMSEVFQGND